jgi:hypothetical protein
MPLNTSSPPPLQPQQPPPLPTLKHLSQAEFLRQSYQKNWTDFFSHNSLVTTEFFQYDFYRHSSCLIKLEKSSSNFQYLSPLLLPSERSVYGTFSTYWPFFSHLGQFLKCQTSKSLVSCNIFPYVLESLNLHLNLYFTHC